MVGGRSKAHQPNWLEQGDSTTFLGGTAVGGNQSIAITVFSGSDCIRATTDHTTNDVQFAVWQFGVD